MNAPHAPDPPSYYLPALVAITVVVEDQALPCQSLLDLAAVSRPTPRADWSDLLVQCAAVQRHMSGEDWTRMGTAILMLACIMRVTLPVAEAADLIEYATTRARRDGPQLGFAALAHNLCVLAVQ